jgi:hypothetical protein
MKSCIQPSHPWHGCTWLSPVIHTFFTPPGPAPCADTPCPARACLLGMSPGPLVVFRCDASATRTYVIAELLAALLACSVFAFVSGFGPLNPFKSTREFGLTWSEALRMWATGALLYMTGNAGITLVSAACGCMHVCMPCRALFPSHMQSFLTTANLFFSMQVLHRRAFFRMTVQT